MLDKSNLLEETKKELNSLGYSIDDIDGIGVNGVRISWEEFTVLADKEYDSGYGIQEVDTDLVIVFHDGSWFERGEYDGSEWWEYKKRPTFNDTTKKITSIIKNWEY